MTAYFITGVGTDVGKTFTTCALLYGAEHIGKPTVGYKPVISGWDESVESDTTRIQVANQTLMPVEEISPWRFAAPLSPHIAAALEGTELQLELLTGWCRERMHADSVALFEGAGGVAAPLTMRDTSLAWMHQLALPVILVSGTYLGSISHTLTAMMALKQAGLHIHALVVNESADAPLPLADAKDALEPFVSSIPLRIYQPRVSSYQAAQEIHALAKTL